jgi:hypothetical protein
MISVQKGAVQMNRNLTSTNIVLCLLSDTIIVTSEPHYANNSKKLLYPPMPLSHISFDRAVEKYEKLYALKLSPYCVLYIMPNDEFAEELAERLFSMKKTNIAPVPALPSFLNAETKVPTLDNHLPPTKLYRISTDGKQDYTIVETSPNSKETVLFKAICKPYVFKPTNQNEFHWVPQSRGVLVVTQLANGKNVITLEEEGTFLNRIRTSIHANTWFKKNATQPNVLDIVLQDTEGLRKYAFRFKTLDIVNELIHALDIVRLADFHSTLDVLSPSLTLDPYQSEDLGVQVSWVDRHDVGFITLAGKTVSIGPIVSSIARYGNSNIQTTRLILRSLLTNAVVLNTPLLDQTWHAKVESKDYVWLRIFGKHDVDYQLKTQDADAYIRTLKEESQRAMEAESLRLERLAEEERKKEEEEAVRVSVLRSLFEMRLSDQKQAQLVKIDSKMDEQEEYVVEHREKETVEEIPHSTQPVAEQEKDDEATLESCEPKTPVIITPKQSVKRIVPRTVHESSSSDGESNTKQQPNAIAPLVSPIKYENDRMYRTFLHLLQENQQLEQKFRQFGKRGN